MPPCPECQNVSAHHAYEIRPFDTERFGVQARRKEFACSNQDESDQTEDEGTRQT